MCEHTECQHSLGPGSHCDACDREAKTPKRSCNRHSDCDKADIEAKTRGAFGASHCHDDECEECFGK